jgi:hypothetical protein
MKCENDKKQLARFINNEMNDAERAAFEIHLAECAACRQEVESDQQVWDLMGEIAPPQPSELMRPRFYAMLDTYKESQEEWKSPFAGIFNMFRQLWAVQPGFRVAYSVVLVVMGLGLGYYFSRPGGEKQQMATLTEQVKDMKAMMTIALLENPSASERMRGVSYTSEIKVGANKQVIDALFTTLNNDPNVNVRLMTLEALGKLAGNAAVREGLVQSIMEQESPLVQSALADVMLKLQEKRSVQPFRKLLQQKDLNSTVRSKIEETITGLI